MSVPDARMELRIGGEWVDVTDHVRRAGRISHERGRREGGARVDPASAAWTMDSPNGLYSNRNPRSEYFGLLGRNNLARCTVAGPTYLATSGDNTTVTGASTPDTAALDITGDIDIRMDVTMSNWPEGGGGVELCGKGTLAGNQRSWLLLMRDGLLRFEWSTAGTSTLAQNSTTGPTVSGSGRLAVRVTLDVDNGAAGHTVTFYTAPTIAGPWTRLGNPVTAAGATSIFNSTAPLAVANGWSDLGFASPNGKTHAFELRSGIAGTVVANPDFTVQAAGATSFTDGAGRTWTIGSTSSLTDRWTRFNLPVSEWPPSWHPSGHDVTASLRAGGTIRRLGQGHKPLDSTLRRRIPSYSPLAYWPLEDQGDSSSGFSPIRGVGPLRASLIRWGENDTLASSGPLPVINSAAGNAIMYGRVPAPATAPSVWSVMWMYRLDLETLNTTLFTLMRVPATGTVAEWFIQQEDNTSRLLGRDSDGATVVDQLIATGPELYNQWIRLKFNLTQDGGNVDWELQWSHVGGTAYSLGGTYAGTVGRPLAVASPEGGYAPAFDGMSIGHISVWTTNTVEPYDGAQDAWSGEAAGARLTRLSAEEDLPITVFGVASEQTPMGAQLPSELLTLLEQCEESDGGILYEDRETTNLRYRDRASLYNQAPALTVSYGQLAPPLTPIDDDRTIRNDVTVKRIGGSSARVVVEDGPLSVLDPEAGGVGVYDEEVSLSLHDDDQAIQHASWRSHLGTWDEARYPSVRLYLHRYPELVPDVLRLDIGDVIRVTDLPDFLPPGPLDLMVQGYSEDIDAHAWEVTLYCTPAGPYTVGVVGDDDARADTSGSALVTAVDGDDTALMVRATVGERWVDSATYPTDFPLDVKIGGEVVTATAITPARSDAFGRTVASSWGTADIGGAWSQLGGTAANYSVSGAYGVHTLTTLETSRRTFAAAPGPDLDFVVDVGTSALAAGASMFGGLMARAVDLDNLYHARVEFTTSATVNLAIRKRVAAAESTVGSSFSTGLTHVAGTFYRVRFQLSGTALRARVWLASGNEPGTWQIDTTDASFSAAANAGCRSLAITGNTNVSPEIRYDNFAILNPQSWTVTRSANGIVKSHAAGADVRLARPTYVAL